MQITKQMGRALTVSEVLGRKREVFPFEGAWASAFGQPERTGVWFIWGNSGNGKSSFLMQLCKELCRYDRVLYDSMEEGASLTMRQSLVRHGMGEAGRRFSLLDDEDIEELMGQDEGINITCNFCNNEYHFDKDDLQKILDKMNA